jgi:hypothetical protein
MVGCATYQTKVDGARKALWLNNSGEAVKILQPLAEEDGKDQLVYLFDYATALQAAGQYKESNKAFLLAERLADLKNYHSVSKITESLILNEEMVQYKGDDFEKLMINVMAALNFLMLGDHENALVEIRALNDKLEYYRIEEKRQYEQNTMALYLSGLMWEDDRNYDSAYINYEKAYNRDPHISLLREDLVRLARLADRPDAYEKWSKLFGLQFKPEWKNKNLGEVVFIYQQGWGPRKYPRPESPRFPKLFAQPNVTKSARFEVVGGPTMVTQSIYSVQDVAIKTLDDGYAALVAKRLAGIAAKAVVSNQVAKKDQNLGALLNFALNAADRADLRQWSTLPETFQVARVYLPAGVHKISAQGLSSAGNPTDEKYGEREIEIRPNRKTFVFWRSFH